MEKYIWHEMTELLKAIDNTSEQEVLETFAQWLYKTNLIKEFDQEKARLSNNLLSDVIEELK